MDIETYHRKRSKRTTISPNNEIMSLKRQEITSVLDGAQAQTSPLARQFLLSNDRNDELPDEEVELGSVYEIYHKNLPPRTPVQLRSTRVVMVSEKTDLNVAIRYPSILSLRTYFNNGITEMYPALDEKFVMGIKLASKVLFRQVPSQEFAEKKHLEDFWLVNPNFQVGSLNAMKIEEIGLARELKNNEMVRWGVRRQVMFIGRHRDMSKTTQSSSSFINGDDQELKNQEINDDDDDEEVDYDEDDDNVKRNLKKTRNLRKRKRVKPANNQLWQVKQKPMKKCKQLAIVRDPTDRWSKERYLAAEISLLEAMKEKKAMIGNPITRPALRVEARKRIGDTGLLDHLLKHVANKVAPGGVLRFRRSHNADGAMEYWLENADLLKIRKDAGVSDPFWTPPPGWKPGDSPIQDPIMAKELSHLKEEISFMKREFISKKQFEEEMANLNRVIAELVSKNKKEQIQDIVVYEGVDTCPKLNSSDIVDDSLLSKEKCKKQMSLILKNVETWMQAEKPTMPGDTEELINTPTPQKHAANPDKKKEASDQETSEEGGRKVSPPPLPPPAPPAGEGKAAKIERLKSGFRLCRPQGTFLWPNTSCSNTTSSQVVVQVEDLLVVPTPPSVNSSTPPQLPYHHHPPSPVKPVPERRAVTVTVSTVTDGHPPVDGSSGNNFSSSSSTTTTLINLNDIPTNPSITTTTIVPVSSPKLVPAGVTAAKNHEEKRKNTSSSASSSCLSNTVTPAAWLSDSGRV